MFHTKDQNTPLISCWNKRLGCCVYNKDRKASKPHTCKLQPQQQNEKPTDVTRGSQVSDDSKSATFKQ